MITQFAPEQPQRKVVVEITAREAHLIKIIRKCSFGKIVVHIANGLVVRAEPNESQLINEVDGLDLKVEDGK